jgi:hypothetical protein
VPDLTGLTPNSQCEFHRPSSQRELLHSRLLSAVALSHSFPSCHLIDAVSPHSPGNLIKLQESILCQLGVDFRVEIQEFTGD